MGANVAAANTRPAARESFASICVLLYSDRTGDPAASHLASSEPPPIHQTTPERRRNTRFIRCSRQGLARCSAPSQPTRHGVLVNGEPSARLRSAVLQT